MAMHAHPRTKEYPDGSQLKPRDWNNIQDKRHSNRSSHLPSFRWWLTATFAAFVAAYGIFFLTGRGLIDPDVRARILANTDSKIHIVGGIAAIALGPIQFLDGMRLRWPAAHRWLGRIYAAAILQGGLAGFYASFHSYAYRSGQLGFALLAIFWLVTVAGGVNAISWKKDISSHRRWMTRNFALTYAAVMLRWQVPLMAILGMDVKLASTIAGWSCWVPNLILVEYMLK